MITFRLKSNKQQTRDKTADKIAALSEVFRVVTNGHDGFAELNKGADIKDTIKQIKKIEGVHTVKQFP